MHVRIKDYRYKEQPSKRELLRSLFDDHQNLMFSMRDLVFITRIEEKEVRNIISWLRNESRSNEKWISILSRDCVDGVKRYSSIFGLDEYRKGR